MAKNKKKKRIGKVNPILYAIVYIVLKIKYTRKYKISYDKKAVKGLRGPAIVIASHTCDKDHILSAMALYPVRPTYIISEHFVHIKSSARLLKLMPTITKKMFTPDVSTIINIMRAKGENAVIVIFPEGRLSCYGQTMPIAEGTAELIKKLGVDLYAFNAEGAYRTFPKWRDKGDDRIGKINLSVKRLLTAEEVGACQVSEIKRITEEAIFHNDEADLSCEYKCDDITRGLDKILYKCPKCLSEDKLTTRDGHIKCECGFDATLDNCYKLHSAPFDSVNAWFEWQEAAIDTENVSLFSTVRLGACGADGFIDPNAGEGEIYIDKDVFKLSGTIFGEAIDYTVSSIKIGAFPITPGDHFDIYIGGKLVYVYPTPDSKTTVKWVSYLDKLNAIVRKNKESATI